MLHMAQAAGEHEKILQGLYENFLEAKTKDPHMYGVSQLIILWIGGSNVARLLAICWIIYLRWSLQVIQAYEWICFEDQVNQQVSHSQDYSLMAFLPYLPVAFHLLFASNAPHKVNYPRTGFEVIHPLSYIAISH